MTSLPSPGATASAGFTFDLDAEQVWLAENPSAERRPVLLSQGTYGPKVGLPAVLRLLRDYAVRSTFYVPGRVAETHPGAVELILAGGHEVAHHGYTHKPPAQLTPNQEIEELERGLEALRRFGVEPTGYRAPSWDLSQDTLGLLESHGFDYSSNFMDDVRPYIHPTNDIVELPVHWTLDDAAHFWFDGDTWTKKISTNAEVEQIMVAEAAGITAMGGCAVYTFHPQFIGRPGRLQLLEELLRQTVSNSSIWVATSAEIAAATRKQGQ